MAIHFIAIQAVINPKIGLQTHKYGFRLPFEGQVQKNGGLVRTLSQDIVEIL
jgi:hypothetical protein